MPTPPIDLDRLLELRLVVARFGEMNLAKWWNTRGQLGRLGTAALTWVARKAPTRSADELIRERTSPAIKSALKTPLEAPGGGGPGKKTKKGKASA